MAAAGGEPGQQRGGGAQRGGTLAVVFLAVEVLAAPEESRFNWSTHPMLGLWPRRCFISLLALTVLLQGLQSISRLANNASVGTFLAECRARVTARINSQVLRFSFPCASAYRVGDLTDNASQGPEVIRIQIEQSGQLMVLLLLSSTVLAVALMGGLITLLQKQLLQGGGFQLRRRTRIVFLLSQQDPPPEQTTQPPAARKTRFHQALQELQPKEPLPRMNKP